MDRRSGGWMAAFLVLALMGIGAPAAQAGTYDVSACDTPAGTFTNHSWVFASVGSARFGSGTCEASGATMYLSSNANQLYGPGWNASMTFSAPAGATIADFRLQRFLFEFNPVDNDPVARKKLYDLGQLGSLPFELTGQQDPAVQAALGDRWYGGGEAWQTIDPVVTRSSFAALAGYKGDATFLRYAVGCHTTPCTLWTNGDGAAGSILAQIFSATVTVNDPTKPSIDRVLATGLGTGGLVGGDEPLAFDATDNSGIKSAQLVDATPGGPETVVGRKEFACDYSYAAPCPQASGAEITPSGLPAGQRLLKVQVTDAGGNVSETPLFPVTVGGPLNGTAAEPGAKLTATFPRNRRGALEVGYGKRASIRGKLTTAAGVPIGGAMLQVLDRQLRSGTRYAVRTAVTTAADGSFTVLPGTGTARAIRFEYRHRRLLANPDVATKVELRVQAGATLKITPTHVRPRGTIRISGRLKGLPLPRSGKLVEIQAFEAGKWRAVGTARARGTAGRFALRYRFLRAGRGASFLIRARIRRDDSYPYYLGYSPRVRVRVR
jgi:hypothetical protein